jgi:hypothetical protein
MGAEVLSNRHRTLAGRAKGKITNPALAIQDLCCAVGAVIHTK